MTIPDDLAIRFYDAFSGYAPWKGSLGEMLACIKSQMKE